ncbi:ferredoxin--NADP reductase [Frankia gtarii]|uniref:ferredoxin--NADP reductase n=1 Tax=Frankia gtarii TaxID=2950102 RepID=UPI0021BFF935|nr:ferredoxin--NADP reductase [Frankia gtarii]
MTTDTAPGGHSRVLRVARVAKESPDAVSIVFEVDTADAAMFEYKPGQFLTLRIPSDQTGSVSRCYSISSSPFVDDELKVTVKRTPAGYGSNWLCDNIAAGMEIQVLPPGGVFVPKSLDGDLLLCGGGSGITPLISILKSALSQGSGRIVLLYANRDESSVIFREELIALARRSPDRLAVLHWLETVQGLPSREQLQVLLSPYAAFEAFTCGPAPFMAVVNEALTALRVPRDRMHTEVFRSLSGDPFTDVPVPVPDTADDVRTVAVKVQLMGKTHDLVWPVTVPLTDLLLDRGIDAPYSCREGECGTCTAQVVRGKVRMLRDEVLDPIDVTDGYILTCQSVPESDDIEIVF